MKLSLEQEHVLQLTKACTPHLDDNYLVRVTAAAGTGKTTTLLALAEKCAQLGHSHLTYVTFSKSATTDGKRRIEERLATLNMEKPPIVEAHTLHACAKRLLSNNNENETSEENSYTTMMMDDEGVKKFIQERFADDIDSFFEVARLEITKTHRSREKALGAIARAERQVVFFIFKTLTQFCRHKMSLEEFKDASNKWRHYYPAQRYHEEDTDCCFPPGYYNSRVGWYADTACKAWEALAPYASFDLEMKRAQLQGLRISGSVLLVDESQDMDACQVDWVSKQVSHGTHVYLVGDEAQTIYGFRGAKSKFMMDLSGTMCKLTKCWRFGPEIAAVANVVLFAKRVSPQTNRPTPIWNPYTVVGCAANGQVTSRSILAQWQDTPVTLIARANTTLLEKAVSLLGMTAPRDDGEDEDSSQEPVEQPDLSGIDVIPPDSQDDLQSQDNVLSQDTTNSVNNGDGIVGNGQGLPLQPAPPDEDDSEPRVVTQSQEDSDMTPIARLPKIHINGKGENSGMRKWKTTVKEIQEVFDLYKSEVPMALPVTKFREFRGEPLTWNSFCNEVDKKELMKYASTIHIVATFGDRTMEAIRLFEREVMDKKYPAEEADVVLTTTHAAKGMEWDHVQVCNDFLKLCSVRCDGPPVKQRDGKSTRPTWQFHFQSYGDEVNILYVACTRARKLLSIPPAMKDLLSTCDLIHTTIRRRHLYKVDGKKCSNMAVFGQDKPLSVSSLCDLYQDIVVPLRRQHNVEVKQSLLWTLVSPTDDDDVEKEEELPGDDELYEYFYAPVEKATAAAVEEPKEEPDCKKPKEEIPVAVQVLTAAKASASHASKSCPRPYDKKESSPNGAATCRQCRNKISIGETRIGIQVYKPDKVAWWASYFHEACCPKEVIRELRLAPPGKASHKRKRYSNKKSGYSNWSKKRYSGRYRRY